MQMLHCCFASVGTKILQDCIHLEQRCGLAWCVDGGTRVGPGSHAGALTAQSRPHNGVLVEKNSFLPSLMYIYL